MEENKAQTGAGAQIIRKTHIIHDDDLDGICAAVIAAMHCSQVSGNRTLIVFSPVHYNRPVDVSQMSKGDRVIIVDFSYPPAEMKKIEDAVLQPPDSTVTPPHCIIWIDHHASAAEYGHDYPGLRDFADKGRAACELTWEYFYPLIPIPRAVSYIGDYDAWRHAIPDSREFYEGAKLFLLDPHAPLWATVFNDDNAEAFQLVVTAGYVAKRYRDVYCYSIRNSYGYETVIAGHQAYALNVFGFGSGAFGDLYAQYPLVIAYIHDGVKFRVSLYSEAVDVGAIAQSMGGGGHKGAAGFVCDILPFSPALARREKESIV